MSNNTNEPVLPGEPNNFTDEQLDQEAKITPADMERAILKARQATPDFFKMINAKKTDKGRE